MSRLHLKLLLSGGLPQLPELLLQLADNVALLTFEQVKLRLE